ncbi:pentatricopeptide repeat-containing protein At1g02150-like [Carya illinoinensis]|uniref:pentatricopeptide repeat-containing protein At1g02150-like n=1 Tax=Carya illinoinensis TaxID=32201 RepID=UPI001C718960|nr:pentatricopeptide repeat-containing protein At1g02150-like [Carya illinoinensis]
MILKPNFHHYNASLSSSLSYSRPLPCRVPTWRLPKTANYRGVSIHVTCSTSRFRRYGTVDFERIPTVKWNVIYNSISLMENPELGSASVLNQWEKEGRKLSKWELCRVVKELRKYRKHKQALEVYDWMNDRGERFILSTSDAAVQLDLIAKVHGVSGAEDYFMKLPDSLKDRRIYGALLNVYVRATMREEAESLLDKMRSKDYATHSLPFNVMMTLYMNLKEYDKVESMVSEMVEKSIPLDIYSYSIWLSSRGSQGSAEKMEEVFEQMKLDRTINRNWSTFSTMATMYIKMGQLDKAEDCLKQVESRIKGRNRIPYHYLISLYGNVGNKEEAYRVWKVYKASFPIIPNLGYHVIISSLVRLGDIKRAEKIYEEWLQVKSSFDPRIGNLLMAWYVREGSLDKAESFFNHMIEVGGKPNSSTWEILVERHMAEKRISEALSCLKEAFKAVRSKSWRPKPVNVSAFFKLCEEKDDTESKEVLVGLLRQSRYLEDEAYASLIGLSLGDSGGNGHSAGADNDGSEVLPNQF